MSSFYYELSSNSDENNTVANFKNKIELLTPLYGNWEVALVEISYTKSWKNLRNGYAMSLIIPKDPNRNKKMYVPKKWKGVYFPKTMGRRAIIQSGYYESVQQLLDELNEEMLQQISPEGAPKFHVDPISKLVYLKVGADSFNELVPNLPDELCDILGFPYQYEDVSDIHSSNGDKYIIGERPADLEAWLHSLYVYCDIVTPQHVCGTRAKLLRAVEVPSDKKFGDQVVIPYDTPHYVDVLVNDFEEVEIDIRDDTNTRIPFMYGRARLKLHFRPKK